MTVSNKIKALIKIKGQSVAGLAEHLDISKQALTNKFCRGSFSTEDAIKISTYLGCELAFIVDDKTKITLDTNDIREFKQ